VREVEVREDVPDLFDTQHDRESLRRARSNEVEDDYGTAIDELTARPTASCIFFFTRPGEKEDAKNAKVRYCRRLQHDAWY